MKRTLRLIALLIVLSMVLSMAVFAEGDSEEDPVDTETESESQTGTGADPAVPSSVEDPYGTSTEETTDGPTGEQSENSTGELPEDEDDGTVTYPPLIVNGIEVDLSSDNDAGWSEGCGWKYFAGKYLYLYNCDISAGEIEINGTDLSIYCEGVNRIGKLSSDRSVLAFGSGVTMVDTLNMNSDGLTLDSNSAPAFFLKQNGAYTLQNPSSAAGRISGTNTLPDGLRYVIPNGTELDILVSSGSAGSLTVLSETDLRVGGTLKVAGSSATDENNVNYNLGSLTIMGGFHVLEGAAVKLEGTIILAGGGSVACGTAILADTESIPGRVQITGNCGDSNLSIQGGYVQLGDESTLGTLSSTGNTILCICGPYSATVNNLERPNGGILEIHGYVYEACNGMGEGYKGVSSLHITGNMACSCSFHDGFYYVSKAPEVSITVASGWVMQDEAKTPSNVTLGNGAKWYIKGESAQQTDAENPSVFSASVVRTDNKVSDSGCTYTTQTYYELYREEDFNLSSAFADGIYTFDKDIFSDLVNDDLMFKHMAIVVGTDLSGNLIAVNVEKGVNFTSVYDIIIDEWKYERTDTGESGSSSVTTNVGGSSLGGSDSGNSTSSGRETTVNTGSTYQYRIVASASEGGSITPVGTNNVGKGSSQTFTFLPETGYRVSTVKVNGTAVSASESYTFSNVSANGTIRVTFKKQVFTVTKSASAGGMITGADSAEYGTSKTYTFTPDQGYEISSVTVNGVTVGTPASYTVSNITENITVMAVFSLRSYQITIPTVIGGTISGPDTVTHGSEATWTVALENGYEIRDLKIGGVSYGAVTSASAVITADTEIQADIRLKTFKISIPEIAGGEISGPGSVEYGSTAVYTVTPDTGYELVDVRVNGVSCGNSGTVRVPVTDTFHISAELRLKTYEMSIAASEGGTVKGPESAEHFSEPVYMITPDVGYEITDVLVDGVSVGAVTEYCFASVDSGHTLSAEFRKITFTVTAEYAKNGSISPTAENAVEYGDSIHFTIRPDEGYTIDAVYVDGVNVGRMTEYTLNNVTEKHVISAAFVEEELAVPGYAVEITAGEGGTVLPEGTVEFAEGSDGTLTFVPDTGYTVLDVKIDGISVGAVDSFTFRSIAETHTVSAEFRLLEQYTVTVSAGEGGTVDPTGTQTVTERDSLKLSIEPDDGYVVAEVLVNGESVGAVSEWICEAVNENLEIEVRFEADAVAYADEEENGIAMYRVTMKSGKGGTVRAEDDADPEALPEGSSVTVRIVPDEGYRIADVLVDGVSVGAAEQYRLENITEDHEISAVFEKTGTGIVLPAVVIILILAAAAAVIVIARKKKKN